MAQEQDLRDAKPAGVSDDLEGGTTGSASMTGGDRNDPSYRQSSSAGGASPAGRVSPAGDDMPPLEPGSVGGSPVGEAGGGIETGPGGQGSFASGTYNERGDVTGPGSPAGSIAAGASAEQGQGDDLANRLGGGDNAGTGLSGAGAASGDMGADRSEASGASAQTASGVGGPDGGSPGGMGGVRAQGGTGTGRPPGGVSPVQNESND
jgi:hypothetical protein